MPFWSANQPFWFPEEFNWVIGCTYRGMPTKNAPVRNLIGANMSVRKDVFTKVGGFRDFSGITKMQVLPKLDRNGCTKRLVMKRLSSAFV